MNPCVSEACTMPASFAEDVAAWAEAGCTAMEVWLTKLEKHVEQHSIDDAKKLLADRGVKPVAGAYQGGLLLSQGEARRTHFDHFKRRLSLCEGLGIGVMLLAADFSQRPEPTDLERAVVSLAQAAQWAAGFGVRLGLEFRAGDSFCATLDTAVCLVEASGEPNVGVCLDLFHYYTGPSKFEDLDRLTHANLAHVQVCDLAGVPREWAGDADRILPGEGDWRLGPIVSRLNELGYDGYVSLETMNPVLWQSRPRQVAEFGLAALNRLLGRTG